MKNFKKLAFFLAIALISTACSTTEDTRASLDINRLETPQVQLTGQMRADTDGVIESDEYRVISENGRLTRRPCPYTCEMRGIPRIHCHEIRSIDGSECYIEDTRLPDDALPK